MIIILKNSAQNFQLIKDDAAGLNKIGPKKLRRLYWFEDTSARKFVRVSFVYNNVC
jgi:hypothetical protein